MIYLSEIRKPLTHDEIYLSEIREILTHGDDILVGDSGDTYTR